MTTRKVRTRGTVTRYAPASRLHELRALLDGPEGVSIYDVAERFGVNPRTALRYIQALAARRRAALRGDVRQAQGVAPHADGAPPVDHADDRADGGAVPVAARVRLPRRAPASRRTWTTSSRKLEATLRRKDFAAVRNLDRKVFDVNEARHLYEGRIEDVNDIMTALLREERLRVTHEGVSGGRKTFVLEPYTLLVYKKGLYLAGRSEGHGGEIRTFALDGFRAVEWLRGERFEYPADYRPEQITEGAFGLIRGKERDARADLVRREGRALRPAPDVAPDAAVPEGRRRRRRDDDGRARHDGDRQLGARLRRQGARHRAGGVARRRRRASSTAPRAPIVNERQSVTATAGDRRA